MNEVTFYLVILNGRLCFLETDEVLLALDLPYLTEPLGGRLKCCHSSLKLSRNILNGPLNGSSMVYQVKNTSRISALKNTSEVNCMLDKDASLSNTVEQIRPVKGLTRLVRPVQVVIVK